MTTIPDATTLVTRLRKRSERLRNEARFMPVGPSRVAQRQLADLLAEAADRIAALEATQPGQTP